ncbi:MAG: site-specific DNA-methyltransferase [Candidatus Marinimicrobia bacterium]|nr:site-specific DNA-methyltransferase [Candidatus Neomarinimicrobiota bacterium]MCF7829195.1 site-specific DNA-methyltransferase [Candidatus Neomarinimicrobiota bacterium]MCF7881152.1 site-specific DNA-methyltransferase [Candidatus Neomarinimicrobiota bacterium]
MTKEDQSYINRYFNENCIAGCEQHIPDDSIDLIVTDPPYGIEGDTLHKHYNRDEAHVIDGYVEVPQDKYGEFSRQWITQAERILRPGGSIYIVSGYTNLYHILETLRETSLQERNHIIWKYNFGVYTKKKYVSSHYHILYYIKPGGPVTFNTFARYGSQEKDSDGGSLNYQDREDVWVINREYKPGQKKNKNELPTALLKKIIRYSSNPGDVVGDLFLGSFSTAKVARGLNRKATGFELSKSAYTHQITAMENLDPGFLMNTVRQPENTVPRNQGKPWTEKERADLESRYRELRSDSMTKQDAIGILCDEFGRGHFGILNKVDEIEKKC